jgi:2-polyprenyl-6-methoxyphenol hydroxylase-like FAD-dependent oxidoreductase
VSVVLGDGGEERFDLVIGADGYCSTVRDAIRPEVRPQYAGYVLWRGNYGEHVLGDAAVRALLDAGAMTVCFAGGHLMVYLIPGQGGGTARGERRVNWALYGAPPPGPDFTDPGSFPPGTVPASVVERLDQIVDRERPPAWADVVRASGPDGLSVQPIYDHAVASFVSGRVVLVGDAAMLSRPHTASGLTKALQEALAFETAGATCDAWPKALAAFDAQRCPAATDLVETSRLLGRGLVEQTPNWTAMDKGEAEHVIVGLIAGRRSYIQPSAAADPPRQTTDGQR